tara:strand:- start:24745 stop:25134 length:390 start_codon:yes stop_codon:yes gene_type:complete
MYPISNNTPYLPGGAAEVDPLSPFHDERKAPRPEAERDGGRPVRLPVDEVRLSEEARRAIALKPVVPKPHATPLGGDPLTTAAREALSFLNQHPKIAEMPLGEAVGKLVRGVAAQNSGTEIGEASGQFC